MALRENYNYTHQIFKLLLVVKYEKEMRKKKCKMLSIIMYTFTVVIFTFLFGIQRSLRFWGKACKHRHYVNFN